MKTETITWHLASESLPEHDKIVHTVHPDGEISMGYLVDWYWQDIIYGTSRPVKWWAEIKGPANQPKTSP